MIIGVSIERRRDVNACAVASRTTITIRSVRQIAAERIEKGYTMVTIKITNADVSAYIEQMSIPKKISGLSERTVFGIPRGGIPVAYMAAGVFNLRVVDKIEDADYVVDDIVCTGRTRDAWMHRAPLRASFHAMIPKPAAKTWYIFPWEESVVGSAKDIVIRQLQFLGEDTDRDGLKDTPARVVRSWGQLYAGYKQSPHEVLGTVFDNEEKYDQMVLLRDIEFYSTCEHHLLPFYGKAHIAYIPSPEGKIVGISKLSRLVSCFARRLQIQERLTQQISKTLEDVLSPLGVAVFVEAQHLCMMARGVEQRNSVMVTSAITGIFRDVEAARLELLLLKK